VVYSPCGTKIASASGDNTVKIWNAQTGQCVSTLRGHNGPVWSDVVALYKVALYKEMDYKEMDEQVDLTVIVPKIESPLPPLQPAVFPPAWREPPPPALDVFDLDEHFARCAIRS
jgi:hypothetical protein